FVAAPLTAIMVVLREPLTSVFYQYGLFSQSATDRTASTLLYFALGLVGHIVVHVLARAFYAMQDTRTPVAWAIVAVAINVPLMALLVGPMGVEGLALALSISSVLEVIGLLWFLRRRIESVDEQAIVRTLARSAVAGLAAALLMLGGLTLIEGSLGGILENTVGRLLALLFLSAAGGAIFVLVAAALRAPELDQLRGILSRRRRRDA
ncbi:MAG TPA: lipid II flippase MurJ, partial [Candidatus Limnocylindrales bacterium]|nr:lipid II flippase MurJ [Candidatus Limnocylindrales bacterium]